MAAYFANPFFASAYMPGEYWRPDSVIPPQPTPSGGSGVGRLLRSSWPVHWVVNGAADDDEVIMAVIKAFLQKVR